MNIPDEYVETIIKALRLARDQSFKDKEYQEEIKFDRCLLKIQCIKKIQEAFNIKDNQYA